MTESKMTREYKVTPEVLADRIGSGSLPVLATPAVSSFFEETAALLVKPLLAQGEATVGSKISVSHLAPTLPGETVAVTATLTEREGRFFRFELEARDGAGVIATGTHERVAVNADRFMGKANSRKGAAQQ